MTLSHKLVVAALMLAGGYAAAALVGGLTDWLAVQADSPMPSDRGVGQLTRMHGPAAQTVDPATSGQLVPEKQPASHAVDVALATGRQVDNSPTWLAASSQQTAPLPTTVQLASATTAPSATERPIAASFDQPQATGVQTTPKARITNVRAASAEAPLRDASPWDRWPRWDAGSAKAAGMPPDGTTTASGEVPATISRLDVVRRNSPALDRGIAASARRSHIVVDGDSLARLAERYLDDASLGEEIYQLNQDVLTGPDVLPIGVELKIPDRIPAVSAAEIRGTESLAAASPPSGMVPVEWSPRTRDSVPQAELLRPIPAGRSN